MLNLLRIFRIVGVNYIRISHLRKNKLLYLWQLLICSCQLFNHAANCRYWWNFVCVKTRSIQTIISVNLLEVSYIFWTLLPGEEFNSAHYDVSLEGKLSIKQLLNARIMKWRGGIFSIRINKFPVFLLLDLFTSVYSYFGSL